LRKLKIKDILTEPEIRFCGLIGYSGKLIAVDFRGMVPLETDSRQKQMYQESALDY